MSSYVPTEQDVDRLAALVAEEEYQEEIKKIDAELLGTMRQLYGEEVREEAFNEVVQGLTTEEREYINLNAYAEHKLDVFLWAGTPQGRVFWSDKNREIYTQVEVKLRALCE